MRYNRAHYRNTLVGSPRTTGAVDQQVSVAIQYAGSMTDLLDWFEDQPCSCATVGHIVDATGWSRETVRNNLKQLMAGDYAERRYKPTGEYRLIEDPRDSGRDGSHAGTEGDR